MANLDIIEESIIKIGKHHKEKFNSFFGGWYGWEKWLQVELAYELAKSGEANVEKRFTFNNNKKIPIKNFGNQNAFIDIVFRKNNDLTNYYSAIEITVDKTPKALKKVLLDLMKIKALKDSEWEFRSVFAILIHENSSGRLTNYSRLRSDLKENFPNREVKIGRFSILIFGWEPQQLVRYMIPKNYASWLTSVKGIYSSHGVTPRVTSLKSMQN